jgi:hydrogenase maturation protease
VGLGNPILGDDGVGWRVADLVQARAGDRDDIEVTCAAVGGLTLMELLIGYDRAVIVDAVHTGSSPAGAVTVTPLRELSNPSAGHTTSAHDTSLPTAIATAAALHAPLPTAVTVVGVEVPANFVFSEDLSPPVAGAVEAAAALVFDCVANNSLLPTGQTGGTHGIP